MKMWSKQLGWCRMKFYKKKLREFGEKFEGPLGQIFIKIIFYVFWLIKVFLLITILLVNDTGVIKILEKWLQKLMVRSEMMSIF